MRVIRAKEGDVKDICACYVKSLENVNRSCYSEGVIKFLIGSFGEKEFLGMIKFGRIFCVKKKGRVAGFVFVDEDKIDGLYVHPFFVGRGCGKKLVRFAEKRIKRSGYIYSRVYSTLNSEGFYSSLGYSSLDVVVADIDELLQFVLMRRKISS
jgi:GNAT superfamily N-acetyltransferase